MKKDFDRWNENKKHVDNKSGRYYRRREIWWCALGLNVGNEQNGSGNLFQRPVLVVRELSINTCVVVPLTTSKEKHPMRIYLGKVGGKESFAIISQIRVVDTKRFTERLGILDKSKFYELQKTIGRLFR